jgi:hypothetical protein
MSQFYAGTANVMRNRQSIDWFDFPKKIKVPRAMVPMNETGEVWYCAIGDWT